MINAKSRHQTFRYSILDFSHPGCELHMFCLKEVVRLLIGNICKRQKFTINNYDGKRPGTWLGITSSNVTENKLVFNSIVIDMN